MRTRLFTILGVVLAAGFLIAYSGQSASAVKKAAADAQLAEFQWHTVVNNSFAIPDSNANFSSYSQPSINSDGMIVFRARSTGGRHVSGIFKRKANTGKIVTIADQKVDVPYPNNLGTKFREFSAFPRIAANADYIAFEGLHQPVYRYFLDDGEETRIGTAGIYAMLGSDLLLTGASKLAPAPGFEYFGVPGFKNMPFNIFPGGSAITDDGAVVFKGNFTVDDEEQTGIFFRPLINTPGGGTDVVGVIATSMMDIPNQPPSGIYKELTFDSTAPPTVAGNRVIFLGLDNEWDPHVGGIYIAEIKDGAPFEAIVEIGSPPPGLEGTVPALTRLGEGLSFDGRYIAFWGAWGNEMRNLRLNCPADGNPDIVAYCRGGDPRSQYDEENDIWYQMQQVPENQGIFLYDVIARQTYLVADNVNGFSDFQFWVYSGKVPGSGGGDDIDAEPPRWRSSAFAAVSETTVVFKARTAVQGKDGTYFDPKDGIYMKDPVSGIPMLIVAETGMDGALFDPALTPGTMPVTELGIERDGFRGRRLAINLAMGNEEAGWGGIYFTVVGGSHSALPTKEADKSLSDRLGKKRQ
ncbi:MAG: hypothetical protein IPM63_17550 [Acidobacteriota bacterium]|nr:MAG: hypothetical protein IPM63_17550 [Acidobacteriota bacterium]